MPAADVVPLVPLLTKRDAPLLLRSLFQDGDPGPIAAALANVPELVEVMLPFIGRVLGPSAIDLRTKELVILRTSVVAACRYCVDAHTVVALESGVSRPEVDELRGSASAAIEFSARERALLAWVDEVALGRGEVDEQVTSAMQAQFVDYEVVELTLLIATTLMLNRFCTALRLPSAPGTLQRLADEGLE